MFSDVQTTSLKQATTPKLVCVLVRQSEDQEGAVKMAVVRALFQAMITLTDLPDVLGMSVLYESQSLLSDLYIALETNLQLQVSPSDYGRRDTQSDVEIVIRAVVLDMLWLLSETLVLHTG